MALPLYDNHLHLSPSGRNIDALREFKAAGGTGLTLVTLPYSEVKITCGEDFRKAFDITVKFAEQARELLDLQVNVAVGPYPILLISLAEVLGRDEAEKILMKGMDIAAEYVAEGKANVIGEVGRPHFPTDQCYVDACNRVLQHGMDLAHQIDCPIMIHCESEDYTCKSLSEMAKSSGLNPGRVIKHSSPPWVSDDEVHGVMPSIPSSRTLIREAIPKGDRFMLETDFIDDPQKPGAMMSVNTVPKRIKAMVSSGEFTEENVYRICSDIPNSLYTR